MTTQTTYARLAEIKAHITALAAEAEKLVAEHNAQVEAIIEEMDDDDVYDMEEELEAGLDEACYYEPTLAADIELAWPELREPRVAKALLG